MAASPLHAVTPIDTVRIELEDTLKLQRDAFMAHPYPSFAERKADLLKLKAFVIDNRDAIVIIPQQPLVPDSTPSSTPSTRTMATAHGTNPCLPKFSASSTASATRSNTSSCG